MSALVLKGRATIRIIAGISNVQTKSSKGYSEQMVIVDGNNVMGQRVGWHRKKSAAQQQLIDEVERIARLRNEPHVLVFDRSSKSAVPDNWSRSPLTVRYARRSSSADELILELAYRHSQHSDILVVTSDRALTRQIHVLGAKVMRSGTFRQMLEFASDC